MPLNQSQHNHVDINLRVVTACPAANANVNSASIDTRGGSTAQPVTASQTVDQLGSSARELMELRARVDAGANLVATDLITIKVQDSDDNAAFADVAKLAAQTVAGIVGNGNAQTDLRWPIPSDMRRYVRINIAVANGAGDVTAQNVTLDLLT